MITTTAGKCTGILSNLRGRTFPCLCKQGRFEVAEGSVPFAHTECTQCNCEYSDHREFYANLVTTSHLLTPRPEKKPGLHENGLILRQDTCEIILERIEKLSVVTVRGPPATGKSTLGSLLISYMETNPTYSSWNAVSLNADNTYLALLFNQSREGGKSKVVESWIDEELKDISDGWLDYPNLLIIIDEGQVTYPDKTFWHLLKDYHKSGKRTKFLLLCAWGSATRYPFDGEFVGIPPTLTEAQCIGLNPIGPVRSSDDQNPGGLFFTEEEFSSAAALFIRQKSKPGLEFGIDNAALEYIKTLSHGHPGVTIIAFQILWEVC